MIVSKWKNEALQHKLNSYLKNSALQVKVRRTMIDKVSFLHTKVEYLYVVNMKKLVSTMRKQLFVCVYKVYHRTRIPGTMPAPCKQIQVQILSSK